jgi:hypothetical protein
MYISADSEFHATTLLSILKNFYFLRERRKPPGMPAYIYTLRDQNMAVH